METNSGEERPAKRVKTSPGPGDEVGKQNGTEVSNNARDTVIRPDESTSISLSLGKERQVGIASFVSTDKEVFQGVFKKRYTDFLVNEILPSGQVLHLKNRDVEGKAKSVKKEKEVPPAQSETPDQQEISVPDETSHEGNQDQTAQITTVSDEDKAKLVGYFSEKAAKEILDLFESMTAHPKKKPRDHPVVKTPFTPDRTVRTEIHQNIRRIFHGRIDSSTNNEGILVLSAANPNFRNNKQSRIGKLSWLERGGEHCHFTLYKEMKDTMETVSFLSYLMKKNPRDFQIAGTKDRRAATVQRISVWRVEAERLAALNRNQAMRNATVGDFEYHPSGLQLGDLAGNEFVVTIRECDFASSQQDPCVIRDALVTALSNLRNRGFLNYYGLQRFGTFAIRSDVLGLQILKGDFEGACNSILDYNPQALVDEGDENGDGGINTNRVGREDRARAQAIKIFRDTGSIKDAVAELPKRLSAEAAVIRTLGKKPNDFLGALMTLQRNVRQMYVHAYQSLVWNMAVTERWRWFGGQVAEGDLVLVKEHKGKERNGTADESTVDADGEVVIHAEGDDRAKTAEDSFERARALTKEEAESGLYTVFDVVLPLPGFDVLYPKNESGEFYKVFMGSEAGGGLDPYDMRRPQKDFSLSGSYRKMVARIGEGYEVDVHRYTRDEEQFVRTDLEILRGVDAGGANEKDSEQADVQLGEQSEEKIAVVVKFQLGSSQYATMALRELSMGGVSEYKPGFSGGR